jgi:hypothetical protein
MRSFGISETRASETNYSHLSALLRRNEKEFQRIFSQKVKKAGNKFIQDPLLSKVKDLRNSDGVIHFPILVKTVKLAPCHSPDFFLSKQKSKIRVVSNLYSNNKI